VEDVSVPDLVVRNLSKSYSGARVLHEVSFEIADGELFTLLGPSGCGKTTTLLAIAGFVRPDSGAIACGATTFFDADAGTDLATERRGLGMVFQSYAVWPHMTVAQNVTFALKLRRLERARIAEKVAETLELVELTDLGQRYPHELSGGQRQRVALARALAYEPSVLLLDEPFSNLDAKLRERTRSWLRRLQRRLALTTVFVTHDQDEAMAMSDGILVLDRGLVQQVGGPEEIYRRPANRFVAGFVGSSNVLDGVVAAVADSRKIEVSIGERGQRLLVSDATGRVPKAAVSVAIRPEAVRLVGANGDATPPPGTPNLLDARVTSCAFLGDHYQYEVAVGDIHLIASSLYKASEGVQRVVIDPDACLIVGPEADGESQNNEGEELNA
jgi:iron(III) transport system ATP-binding protein